MRIVALHGLPTSPRLWERLSMPVIAPALQGVATRAPRQDWSLEGFVAEVLPLIDEETILIGHDLGGVIAALCCLHRPPRLLVLSGTALGPYWQMVRISAWPVLHRYFYGRYSGRFFVSGAVSEAHRAEALSVFPGMAADRMRAIAQAMRPPPQLAQSLRVPVALIWGAQDRWYPPWVAHALQRGSQGSLQFVAGGHFCMWEEPEAFSQALQQCMSAVSPLTR